MWQAKSIAYFITLTGYARLLTNKGVLVLITQSADHSIATRVALGTGETVPLPRRTVRVWRTVILFCIGAVLSRWASGDCLIIHVKW